MRTQTLPLFRAFVLLFLSLCILTSNAFGQCDTTSIDLPFNSIDEDCDGLDQTYLQLPAYLYAIQGSEFSLFFRNVSLLQYHENYTYDVVTPLTGGTLSAESWKLTPTAQQVGEHPFTVRIKNSSGQILASASTTLRISAAQSPVGAVGQKMIILGHSLVDQGVTPFYLRLLTEAPGTPNVSYHGTRISWSDNITHHEGKGGASWRFFARDTASPLLFNGQLNLQHYFDQVVCSGCQPDIIVIQLDVNDYCFTGTLNGSTMQEIGDFIDADYVVNTKPLIDAIRAAAPQTKIAICYTPPANGRPGIIDGFFAPGSVLGSAWRWKKIIHQARLKYAGYFGGRENENIYLIPAHTGVDDIRHFDDLDPIHPFPQGVPENGYHPISRSIFAWLKYQIAQTVQGTCTINATASDFVCDRNTTLNQQSDDSFSFDLKVQGKNAGSGYTATLLGQSANGTFGDTRPYGPLNAASGVYTIEVKSQTVPGCKTNVYASAAPCSNGNIPFVDLSLQMTTLNTLPAPFTTFTVTATLRNESNNPAQGIIVQIPKQAGASYPNANPYSASQGSFDWSFSSLWTVGDLPAQGTATIAIEFYLVTDQIFPLYAQVYTVLQEDLDSKPSNGIGLQANEDDESVLIIGVSDTDSPAPAIQFSFAPNPVRAGRAIYLEGAGMVQNLQLYHLDGRLLHEWSDQTVFILPDQLSAGVYVLRGISKDGKTLVCKLVVE